MSVIKSKRNESAFLYAHNIIELYKFTRTHIVKIKKEANHEKHLIQDATDELLYLAFQANAIEVNNKETFLILNRYLEQMEGNLYYIDDLLTFLKEDQLIDLHALIQWEQLLDKELKVISGFRIKAEQNYKKMTF